MNQIIQILANSIYAAEEFKDSQIQALNEMLDLGINIEQIGIIASPSVSVLSYSILADYLKDHTITLSEYNKYLSIDKDRVNAIIINVYLGKMHGLTEEEINLYANKSCKYIKQSRLIVEKYKDIIPRDKLNKIMTSKCGSDSIEGNMLIQEFLLGNVSVDRFLITCIFSKINEEIAKDIMTGDERLIQLYQNYCTYKNNNHFDNEADKVYAYIHLVYELTLDNTAYANDYIYFSSKYYNEYINGNLRFDSSYSLFYFINKSHDNNVYDLNLTITKRMVNQDTKEKVDLYYINSDGELDSRQRYTLLDGYLSEIICWYEPNTTYYKHTWQEILSWDEFYAMYKKDQCKSCLKAISKGKDIDVVLKYYDYADNFADLIKLYTTKKDKETEIPYLTEQLKNATNDQIKEVICMKENKCSNDEIHYFIEKYLSKITDDTTIRPTTYYNDSDYSKYFTITQYLDYLKFDIDSSDLLKLKQANCTDEEFEFVLNNINKIKFDNEPLQRELIQLYMNIGVNNFEGKLYITSSSELKDNRIQRYNDVKSIFKNKPKCIFFCILHDSPHINIPEHLVTYIDNFDDETLCKILNKSQLYLNFALQMSNVTTNIDEINEGYNKIHKSNESKVEEFNNIDKKITTDVIVKFCKNNKVDVPDFVKDLIPESIDTTIEKSVEYFDSSKNFKPIKYDDETIYVDIIGNKALKGSHIITFNKEEDDDNYEYIFEIAHEDDTLTYSAKIATKKDVKECITKSIALIENIDEYNEYVEELQNLLKTI